MYLRKKPSAAFHSLRADVLLECAHTSLCPAIGRLNWCRPVECKYFFVSTCLKRTLSVRFQYVPEHSTFQLSPESVFELSPKALTSWFLLSGDWNWWLCSHLPVPACCSRIVAPHLILLPRRHSFSFVPCTTQRSLASCASSFRVMLWQRAEVKREREKERKRERESERGQERERERGTKAR